MFVVVGGDHSLIVFVSVVAWSRTVRMWSLSLSHCFISSDMFNVTVRVGSRCRSVFYLRMLPVVSVSGLVSRSWSFAPKCALLFGRSIVEEKVKIC